MVLSITLSQVYSYWVTSSVYEAISCQYCPVYSDMYGWWPIYIVYSRPNNHVRYWGQQIIHGIILDIMEIVMMTMKCFWFLFHVQTRGQNASLHPIKMALCKIISKWVRPQISWQKSLNFLWRVLKRHLLTSSFDGTDIRQ